MTSLSLNENQKRFLSESLPVSSFNSSESTRPVLFPSVDLRFESSSKSSIEALHKILKRLAGMELPGKEHVEAYLRYLCRRNRRPRTLVSLYANIVLFLGMIKDNGKTSIKEITRRDVEAFIEHRAGSRHSDYDNQDKTCLCSSLSPVFGGRGDCFTGCSWQEDTLAVTGSVTQGHGSRRFTATSFGH